VLQGLRGEDGVASKTRFRHDAELRRREGISQNLDYRWSKEFLEAGKKRLAGDTAREVTTSDEVKGLCKEAVALKEVAAELLIENRLLKTSSGVGRAAREIFCTRKAGDHQSGRAVFVVGTAHAGPVRHSQVDILSLSRPLCARRAQCT